MAKKRRAPFVPLIPEDLPLSARAFWPDLEEWPTPARVRQLTKQLKKRDDDRLAVLTGLRRFAVADSNLMLGFIALVVAMLAVVSTVIGPSDISRLIGGAVVLGALIALFTLIRHVVTMDERRRSAVAWLAALEHGL